MKVSDISVLNRAVTQQLVSGSRLALLFTLPPSVGCHNQADNSRKPIQEIRPNSRNPKTHYTVQNKLLLVAN